MSANEIPLSPYQIGKDFLVISVSVRTREQEFSCAAGGNENLYHLPEG